MNLFGFCNDIHIEDDGWAMIAPLGDHPSMALMPDGSYPDGAPKVKRQKAIQRIDAKSVEQMVANFKASRKGLKKYLSGAPIYIGHPDVPGLGRVYPDKEPKGVFADLQARPNGLYGLPVFTNEGSDLVEKKVYRAFSGNIGNSEPDGDKNGLPVFRPTELFSAGLTNTPHLPVEFINEAELTAEAERRLRTAENTKNKNMHKSKIIELLTLVGILNSKGVAFANDAPDEEVLEGLKQLGEKSKTAAVTFANEKAQLESRLTAKDGELNTLKADKATVTTERDTSKTQFANERSARIESELGFALKQGKITEAERPTWKGRLANEAQFANELDALTKLETKVKTEERTAGRGKTGEADLADPRARRQFINEAVDSVIREKGLDAVKDYDKAFNIVQRTHPALFANDGGKKNGKN